MTLTGPSSAFTLGAEATTASKTVAIDGAKRIYVFERYTENLGATRRTRIFLAQYNESLTELIARTKIYELNDSSVTLLYASTIEAAGLASGGAIAFWSETGGAVHKWITVDINGNILNTGAKTVDASADGRAAVCTSVVGSTDIVYFAASSNGVGVRGFSITNPKSAAPTTSSIVQFNTTSARDLQQVQISSNWTGVGDFVVGYVRNDGTRNIGIRKYDSSLTALTSDINTSVSVFKSSAPTATYEYVVRMNRGSGKVFVACPSNTSAHIRLRSYDSALATTENSTDLAASFDSAETTRIIHGAVFHASGNISLTFSQETLIQSIAWYLRTSGGAFSHISGSPDFIANTATSVPNASSPSADGTTNRLFYAYRSNATNTYSLIYYDLGLEPREQIYSASLRVVDIAEKTYSASYHLVHDRSYQADTKLIQLDVERPYSASAFMHVEPIISAGNSANLSHDGKASVATDGSKNIFVFGSNLGTSRELVLDIFDPDLNIVSSNIILDSWTSSSSGQLAITSYGFLQSGAIVFWSKDLSGQPTRIDYAIVDTSGSITASGNFICTGFSPTSNDISCATNVDGNVALIWHDSLNSHVRARIFTNTFTGPTISGEFSMITSNVAGICSVTSNWTGGRFAMLFLSTSDLPTLSLFKTEYDGFNSPLITSSTLPDVVLDDSFQAAIAMNDISEDVFIAAAIHSDTSEHPVVARVLQNVLPGLEDFAFYSPLYFNNSVTDIGGASAAIQGAKFFDTGRAIFTVGKSTGSKAIYLSEIGNPGPILSIAEASDGTENSQPPTAHALGKNLYRLQHVAGQHQISLVSATAERDVSYVLEAEYSSSTLLVQDRAYQASSNLRKLNNTEHTASANLLKLNADTAYSASLDLLSTNIDQTYSASSRVANIADAAYSASALLLNTVNSLYAVSVDLLVTSEFEYASSADLQSTENRSYDASVELVVVREYEASTTLQMQDVEQYYQTSSNIQQTIDLAYEANSHLQKTNDETYSGSVDVLAEVSNSYQGSADLLSTEEETYSSSATLLLIGNQDYTSSANILTIQENIYSSSADVLKQEEQTYESSSSLQEVDVNQLYLSSGHIVEIKNLDYEGSASLQTQIDDHYTASGNITSLDNEAAYAASSIQQHTAESGYSSSCDLQSTEALGHVVSANLMATSNAEYSSSANLTTTEELSYTGSANILHTESTAYASSANILSSESLIYEISCNLLSLTSQDYSSSSNIISTEDEGYTASVDLQRTIAEDYTASSNLLAEADSTYNSSVNTTSTEIREYFSSIDVSQVIDREYSGSSQIQHIDISESYTASTSLKKQEDALYNSSVDIKATSDVDHQSSVDLSATEQKEYLASANLQKESELAHSSSASLLATESPRYTGSVDILETKQMTYESSADLRHTPNQAYTTSSHLTGQFDARYTASLDLRKTDDVHYAVSALIIQHNISESYQASTDIRATIAQQYSSSSNLRATEEKAYSLSANIKKFDKDKTYSASTFIVEPNDNVYEACVTLQAINNDTDYIATITLLELNLNSLYSGSTSLRRETDQTYNCSGDLRGPAERTYSSSIDLRLRNNSQSYSSSGRIAQVVNRNYSSSSHLVSDVPNSYQASASLFIPGKFVLSLEEIPNFGGGFNPIADISCDQGASSVATWQWYRNTCSAWVVPTSGGEKVVGRVDSSAFTEVASPRSLSAYSGWKSVSVVRDSYFVGWTAVYKNGPLIKMSIFDMQLNAQVSDMTLSLNGASESTVGKDNLALGTSWSGTIVVLHGDELLIVSRPSLSIIIRSPAYTSPTANRLLVHEMSGKIDIINTGSSTIKVDRYDPAGLYIGTVDLGIPSVSPENIGVVSVRQTYFIGFAYRSGDIITLNEYDSDWNLLASNAVGSVPGAIKGFHIGVSDTHLHQKYDYFIKATTDIDGKIFTATPDGNQSGRPLTIDVISSEHEPCGMAIGSPYGGTIWNMHLDQSNPHGINLEIYVKESVTSGLWRIERPGRIFVDPALDADTLLSLPQIYTDSLTGDKLAGIAGADEADYLAEPGRTGDINTLTFTEFLGPITEDTVLVGGPVTSEMARALHDNPLLLNTQLSQLASSIGVQELEFLPGGDGLALNGTGPKLRVKNGHGDFVLERHPVPDAAIDYAIILRLPVYPGGDQTAPALVYIAGINHLGTDAAAFVYRNDIIYRLSESPGILVVAKIPSVVINYEPVLNLENIWTFPLSAINANNFVG